MTIPQQLETIISLLPSGGGVAVAATEFPAAPVLGQICVRQDGLWIAGASGWIGPPSRISLTLWSGTQNASGAKAMLTSMAQASWAHSVEIMSYPAMALTVLLPSGANLPVTTVSLTPLRLNVGFSQPDGFFYVSGTLGSVWSLAASVLLSPYVLFPAP